MVPYENPCMGPQYHRNDWKWAVQKSARFWPDPKDNSLRLVVVIVCGTHCGFAYDDIYSMFVVTKESKLKMDSTRAWMRYYVN